MNEQKIVSAERIIQAPADLIFELIADPAQQPRWDGNENLARAAGQQRVQQVGDVFAMTLTTGGVRENHVCEFTENQLIAWRPAEPGSEPIGHLWRWELEPAGADATLVRHSYDYSQLPANDERRQRRAAATGTEQLAGSLARLADLAETLAGSSR